VDTRKRRIWISYRHWLNAFENCRNWNCSKFKWYSVQFCVKLAGGETPAVGVSPPVAATTTTPWLRYWLLHYLVKCRSRSFTIYNNGFILASTCIGSNLRSKSMERIIATSFWDRCCFLAFVQHVEASFSFFSMTVPHHIVPKTQ